jgi:hypothetical protein
MQFILKKYTKSKNDCFNFKWLSWVCNCITLSLSLLYKKAFYDWFRTYFNINRLCQEHYHEIKVTQIFFLLFTRDEFLFIKKQRIILKPLGLRRQCITLTLAYWLFNETYATGNVFCVYIVIIWTWTNICDRELIFSKYFLLCLWIQINQINWTTI